MSSRASPASSSHPGARGEVAIELDERAFAYWSVRLGRWVVEAGDFVLHVGTSSRDLPHAHTVEIEAPSIASPLTRDSTLHEWLADPQGQQLLVAAAGGSSASSSPLADPGLLRVVGTMPMSTLANFGMAGLTHQALDDLVGGLTHRGKVGTDTADERGAHD